MGFSTDVYVTLVEKPCFYVWVKKGNGNGKGENDDFFLSELRL